MAGFRHGLAVIKGNRLNSLVRNLYQLINSVFWKSDASSTIQFMLGRDKVRQCLNRQTAMSQTLITIGGSILISDKALHSLGSGSPSRLLSPNK